MFLEFLTLLGALALFLYGLNLLSNGLQKFLGDRVKTFIPWMKGNPIKQILAGFGLTTSILTSRATTVMVVSFVSAGLLSLTQAVGVIFGANIGTTITAWIITFLGFSIDVKIVGFPLLAIGFIFMVSKKRIYKNISELIIGTALLFVGLLYIKQSMLHISNDHIIMDILSAWMHKGFSSVIIYLVLGIIVAFILQSSSATIALALIMVSASWLPFRLAVAVVLGANIGTTISANLVATKGNIGAKRAALIHLLFNSIGVVGLLIFFNPFMYLCQLFGDCFGIKNINTDFITNNTEVSNALLYLLCAIHTLFNLLNAFILIWFNKLIVKITTILIKDQPNENDSKLKFISFSPISTPSISIAQAYNEVVNFSMISYEGFTYIKKAVNEKDPDNFEEYRKKLVEYEEVSDFMEFKIAAFLNNITTTGITGDESAEIKALYRIIGELESLGDGGENISRILARERVHNRKFDTETIAKINDMVDCVDAGYKIMIENIALANNNHLENIDNAYKAEDAINIMRNKLRNDGIIQIEGQKGNYQSLNYFLDIIAELESMGDFMINVSQAAMKGQKGKN